MQAKITHRPDLRSKKENLPGLEIRFEQRPVVAVRKMLTAVGFRWSRGHQCWYAWAKPERLYVANQIREMGNDIQPDTEPLPPRPKTARGPGDLTKKRRTRKPARKSAPKP